VGVLAAYGIILVVVILLILPHETPQYVWVPYLLVAVVFLLVIRYLTTRYRIDDSNLVATKFLGGRRISLDQVRKIEYAALRDLAPSGFMAGTVGTFGWRGRMWSPLIGSFDSVYTDPSRGLLVTPAGQPLYISPVDPEVFARELSRRVRSYTGPLEKDVGHPGPG